MRGTVGYSQILLSRVDCPDDGRAGQRKSGTHPPWVLPSHDASCIAVSTFPYDTIHLLHQSFKPQATANTNKASGHVTATEVAQLQPQRTGRRVIRWQLCAWSSDCSTLLAVDTAGAVSAHDRQGGLLQRWNRVFASKARVVGVTSWGMCIYGLMANGQLIVLDTSSGQIFQTSVQAYHSRCDALMLDATGALLFIAGPGAVSTSSQGYLSSPAVAVSVWQLQPVSGVAVFTGSWGNAKAPGLSSPWQLALSPQATQLLVYNPGGKADNVLLLQIFPQRLGGAAAVARVRLTAVPFLTGTLALPRNKARASTSDLQPGDNDQQRQDAIRATLGLVSCCTWWSEELLMMMTSSGQVHLVSPVPSDNGAGVTQHLDPAPGTFPPGSSCLASIVPDVDGQPQALIVAQVPAARGEGTECRVYALHGSTAEEQVERLVKAGLWDEAVQCAQRNAMEPDDVFKACWQKGPATGALIAPTLAHMADRQWVMEALQAAVPAEYQDARTLLEYALYETERHVSAGTAPWNVHASGAEDGLVEGQQEANELSTWWLVQRLRVLAALDRLEVLTGVGDYTPASWVAFRDAPVHQCVRLLGNCHAVAALQHMLRSYPYTLGPTLMDVLDCLPETLPSSAYTPLLQDVTTLVSSDRPARLQRAPDWVECTDTMAVLQRSGEYALCTCTEPMAQLLLGWRPPTSRQFADWAVQRALKIDSVSGQVHLATALLRECAHLVPHESSVKVHDALVAAQQLQLGLQGGASPDIWQMSLASYVQLNPAERLSILVAGTTMDSMARDVQSVLLPTVNLLPLPARAAVLQGFLEHEVASRPGWTAALVALEYSQLSLWTTVEALNAAVIAAVSAYPHSSQWNALLTMLDETLMACNGQESVAAEQPFTDQIQSALQVKDCVTACSLLAKWGQLTPLPTLLLAQQQQQLFLLRSLLTKAIRERLSSGAWKELAADVEDIVSLAMRDLDATTGLLEVGRAMLRAARWDLAREHLKPTSLADVEQVVVEIGKEYLYSADDMQDIAVQQAQQCLSTCPSSKLVQQELHAIKALLHLQSYGVSMRPLEFQQVVDRSTIVRQLLSSKPDSYKDVSGITELCQLLGLTAVQQHEIACDMANIALSKDDVVCAQGLCLQLIQQGYAPAHELAFRMATVPAEAPGALQPAVRQQFLLFASAYCDDSQLLDVLHVLRQAEGAPHGYGLVKGATSDTQVPLKGPAIELSDLNQDLKWALEYRHSPLVPDVGVASFALGCMLTLTPSDLQRSIHEFIDAHRRSGNPLRHQYAQRALLLGTHAAAAQAIQAHRGVQGTGRCFAATSEMLHSATWQLLEQLRKLPLQPPADVIGSRNGEASLASEAAALAWELHDELANARDAEVVQQYLSMGCGTEAMALSTAVADKSISLAVSGDAMDQVEVSQGNTVLQLAAAAGQQAAEGDAGAAQLLERVLEMARRGGVEAWDVQLAYLTALLKHCRGDTSQAVRDAVSQTVSQLSARPKDFLQSLLYVVPALEGSNSVVQLLVLKSIKHCVDKLSKATPQLTANTSPALVTDTADAAAAGDASGSSGKFAGAKNAVNEATTPGIVAVTADAGKDAADNVTNLAGTKAGNTAPTDAVLEGALLRDTAAVLDAAVELVKRCRGPQGDPGINCSILLQPTLQVVGACLNLVPQPNDAAATRDARAMQCDEFYVYLSDSNVRRLAAATEKLSVAIKPLQLAQAQASSIDADIELQVMPTPSVLFLLLMIKTLRQSVDADDDAPPIAQQDAAIRAVAQCKKYLRFMAPNDLVQGLAYVVGRRPYPLPSLQWQDSSFPILPLPPVCTLLYHAAAILEPLARQDTGTAPQASVPQQESSQNKPQAVPHNSLQEEASVLLRLQHTWRLLLELHEECDFPPQMLRQVCIIARGGGDVNKAAERVESHERALGQLLQSLLEAGVAVGQLLAVATILDRDGSQHAAVLVEAIVCEFAESAVSGLPGSSGDVLSSAAQSDRPRRSAASLHALDMSQQCLQHIRLVLEDLDHEGSLPVDIEEQLTAKANVDDSGANFREVRSSCLLKCRNAVWLILQRFLLAASESGVSSSVYEEVDELVGTLGGDTWVGWQPPGGVDADLTAVALQRLTFKTIAIVKPLWPDVQVSAHDVASAISLCQLLQQLLASATEGMQLVALGRLLTTVWSTAPWLEEDEQAHASLSEGWNSVLLRSAQQGSWDVTLQLLDSARLTEPSLPAMMRLLPLTNDLLQPLLAAADGVDPAVHPLLALLAGKNDAATELLQQVPLTSQEQGPRARGPEQVPSATGCWSVLLAALVATKMLEGSLTAGVWQQLEALAKEPGSALPTTAATALVVCTAVTQLTQGQHFVLAAQLAQVAVRLDTFFARPSAALPLLERCLSGWQRSVQDVAVAPEQCTLFPGIAGGTVALPGLAAEVLTALKQALPQALNVLRQ